MAIRAISNLPQQITPFIGRADEITRLNQLLGEPNCRLLTLVGPGGIGKTRLAIEVGRQCAADYPDGVYFVRLQPVQSPDLMASTIAETIGFAIHGSQDPGVQLQNHLRNKTMLLILDNMEHLLDGIGLITDMLVAAAQIKMVVTSREALNLRLEWLYAAEGLQYPLDDGGEVWEAYSAVELFLLCARRVRPDFAQHEHKTAVIDICRAVEGMPLALEIAATWVRVLNPVTIAERIKASLDFLTTSQRDMPPRHRSMRAVFDTSWELLSEAEQASYCRLAVFRGGFSADAAMQVANASLSDLAIFIDKSLVQLRENERYDLHELLRQYAAEKLDTAPEIRESVLDRHCEYYTEFLHQRAATIHLSNQAEAVREMDNLRMAWRHAAHRRNRAAIQRAAQSLHWLYHFQGWHDEGAAMFFLAEDALRDVSAADDDRFSVGMLQLFRSFYQPEQREQTPYPPVDPEALLALWDGLEERPEMGLLLTRAIFALLNNVSEPEKISTAARKSLAFSRRHHDLASTAISLTTLAVVSYWAHGAFAEALPLLEEALTIDHQIGFHLNARWSQYVLAGIAQLQGQYAAAKVHIEAGIAHHRMGGIFRNLDIYLFGLGNVFLELGDDVAARRHFLESMAVAADLQRRKDVAHGKAGLGVLAAFQGDFEGASAHYEECQSELRALNYSIQDYDSELASLGLLALVLGHYAEALTYYEGMLAFYEKVRYRVPQMCAHSRIGHVLIGLADQARAKTHLFTALREAAAMGAFQVLLEALSGIAQLSQMSPIKAVELAALVCHHPAANRYSRTQAGRLLATMKARLSQAEFDAALACGQSLSLEEAVALVEPMRFDAKISKQTPDQPLTDPLSQRELDVLALMAAGLTNQEIADQLYIGISTVKKHINHIYSKLGVTHRAQAVAHARNLKILP